ncbi:hypothetical protein [Bacillus sp. FJAT-27264]|nr:hypothetical protein [Bacillus sp. FJAT-27264]
MNPDSNNSWFSGDYPRRNDCFTDVPEQALREINPGSLGYIDKKKN